LKLNTNRITEILMVLTLLGMALLLSGAGSRPAGPGLADVRPSGLAGDELARFSASLTEVRMLVDTNRNAEQGLASLLEGYPGRHEGWALSGRYHEAAGNVSMAVASYAVAVRLEPDYLDENSSLYLGSRIENAAHREFGRLMDLKNSGSLSGEDKALLKQVYFLRRRLAGGCE
jgi:hypothetical protein